MNGAETTIEVTGLVKSFGDVKAVSGIDFSIKSGEIFGFLGPNGSGKTTTISMLIGLARPDHGTIRIKDIDRTARPRMGQQFLGVVPDECNLYPELSGYDNLCFCGALYGMVKKARQQRACELLEQFDLIQAASRRFGSYSKGMKRRLTIAAGIIHRPEILFLDEPTTGIDIASARQVRLLIRDLQKQGTTIFLTTHYIEDAERLCDRIAFMVSGRIVRTDALSSLLEPIRDKYVLEVCCSQGDQSLIPELELSFPDLSFYSVIPGKLRIEAHRPVVLGPLVGWFEKAGMEIFEARRITPSLEDVFVRITGIDAGTLSRERSGGAI